MTKKQDTPPIDPKDTPTPPVDPTPPLKGHKKPTKEELQAKVDNFDDDPQDPPTDPPVDPTPPPAPPVDDPQDPPVDPAPPADPPKDDDTDWKKRYIASTQEGQIQAARNKKVTEAFKKAGEIADPTEDEMKVEYPDWDDMEDVQKKIAKQALTATRRNEAMISVNKEFADMDKWKSKVDKLTDDPQLLIDNPRLEGKIDDLRMFANKPTRINSDFDDIVQLFLYDAQEVKAAKPPKKKQMFDTGTGGAKDKGKQLKKAKLSLDESIALKRTDWKKYKRLLKAGLLHTTEDIE